MNKKVFMVVSLLFYSVLCAKELDSAVNLTKSVNESSVKSQEKIDSLVNKKEELFVKYKRLGYELKSLNSYNGELKDIVSSQDKEKISILKQIDQIDETKRDILPLIKNMLLSLEKLIQNDTPFLYEERTKRVKRLQGLIKRSDISVASKYRAVIEAYEIETEYSRTIETYNDILENKSVKFLRIGRVGFYYVTEDNNQCAIWNTQTKDWHILDNSYTVKLNSAIKIAAKKGVPNLLKLPLFKAKEVM